MYWCSFFDNDENFECVVIGWGKTPSGAASKIIEMGLVERNRAQILHIPPFKYPMFEPHIYIKLSEEDISRLFPDVPMKRVTK